MVNPSACTGCLMEISFKYCKIIIVPIHEFSNLPFNKKKNRKTIAFFTIYMKIHSYLHLVQNRKIHFRG